MDSTIAIADTRMHDRMHPLPDRKARIPDAGLPLSGTMLARLRSARAALGDDR